MWLANSCQFHNHPASCTDITTSKLNAYQREYFMGSTLYAQTPAPANYRHTHTDKY